MPSLPYDIETNLIFRAFRTATVAFRDVATGKRIMCLVSSDPGYGKTLLARRELRVANTAFDETGSITTEQDFVRYMWQIESGIICRKGRKIRALLVDDKDGLLRRETIANQLKAAFGADRRRIRVTTNEAKLNEEYRNSDDEGERKKYKAISPATSFDVTVGMICLANIDYTDPAVVAGLPHFSALVSKGLDPQRIPNDAENGGRDVFIYTHYLATVQNSLGGEGYTYEVGRAAVEFYVRNVHHLIDIPPRRLSMIAKVIKDNPDPAGREERLNAMLRATDQRPKLKIPEEWIPMLLWPSSPPSRPDRQPDRDPPQAASAPMPAAREPNHDTPPAASAPTSIAPEPLPTAGSQAEPPSRYWSDDLPPEPPVASGREPTPTIEEPRSEDLSQSEIVERNRAEMLGAILDTVLPPGDRRQGAFFGAVEQVKAMGGIVDEQVLGHIRRGISDEPYRAAAIFAWDTTRQILDRASIAMTNNYDTDPPPPRELNPAPAIDIDKITMDTVLDDAEMRQLTLQWGLKPFRGRAGPLDIVAYQQRGGFLKIAGPKLTLDELVIVRKKPKAFWQEQGAAERWLDEILNPSPHDDVPQESKNRPDVKSEDDDGEPP